MMTVDNPRVRADSTCPLCNGPKGVGLVACWPCNGTWLMRYGNAEAEARIAVRERFLASEAVILRLEVRS